MADARHRNESWLLKTNADGTVSATEVHIAVLMDIRDELQTLNRLLGCPNFIAVPGLLLDIKGNTSKPRRKKGRKP